MLNHEKSTSFSLFDASAAEALKQKLSESFQGKNSPSIPLRAWVPDCGLGLQAYVTGMLLAEAAGSLAVPVSIQVFATDTREEALKSARAASYPYSLFASLPEPFLSAYCRVANNEVYIKKQLRERVVFSVLDILRDPPLPHLDLIYAPNVLQGLRDDSRAVVLAKFHFALRTGGVLCVGSEDSVDFGPNLFSVLDRAKGMYRANAISRPQRSHPPLASEDANQRSATLTASPVHRLPLASVVGTPEARLHQSLAFQALPPSILVDEKFNIIHVSDGAAQFLKHPAGNPTTNLISLVHGPLQTGLRAALFKAVSSGASVDVRHRGYPVNDWVTTVNMTVRPIATEERKYILISFDVIGSTLDDEEGIDSADSVNKQLEDELASVKRQLQETLDDAREVEIARKAASEESQAVNEELRSVVEEAEASREELLAVNEELDTVNSELTRKVDEAAAANEDLTNFMAASLATIIFIDDEMQVRRFTREATSIFKLRQGDVGRSLFDIRHKLNWPGYEQDLRQVIATSALAEREVTHEDGRHLVVRVSRFEENGGLPSGAMLTFTDVTGLRQAEANIAATEARMSLLARTTKDYAIISLNGEGKILSWNVGAAQAFGYTADEVIGKSGAIIFARGKSGERAFELEMRTALIEGRSDDERWHRRKSGEKIYCSGIMVALYSDDGHFEGFAKITRDVTKQERQIRLREQRILAEKTERLASQEANRLKDKFLAIMSHELKHPLNLISVNAQLLSRLPLAQSGGMTGQALAGIAQAVTSQAKIIDDLLDLSRLNTGKLRLDIALIDVVAKVRTIVTAAQEVALTKDVALSFKTKEPELLIQADAVRFEQVLWNLITNSLKFTPAGGSIEVALDCDETDCVLRVTDTGIGIDQAFLGDIFSLFSQVDAGASAVTGGLGIGLALVKELVEAHGGRVQATSPGSGQGVTMTVWLPGSPGILAPDEDTCVTTSTLAGLSILIVDDAIEASEALAALFETAGAQSQIAHSGLEALAILEHGNFDVLVSDVAMPGMDGSELISHIRASSHAAHLPAIALSGFSGLAENEKLRSAGFDRYLQKPASLAALQEGILDLLAERRSGNSADA